MMKSLQMTPSALEVARLYQDFVGIFVLDQVDRQHAAKVEALGMRALVTNTIMSGLRERKALAKTVVQAL